jgi:hypothetical protein
LQAFHDGTSSAVRLVVWCSDGDDEHGVADAKRSRRDE